MHKPLRQYRAVKMLTLLGFLLTLVAISLTLWVESEAEHNDELLVAGAQARALVLYHPSRDAQLSDDLSLAVVDGLRGAGFSVRRATMTRHMTATPTGFALIVVVSNTYWWTPDLPTLRYLARARFDGVPLVGLIGGAGATARSQRLLGQALTATGAKVLGTHSFWLFRPNDALATNEPNRRVAIRMAKQVATESGAASLALGVSK